MMIYITIRFELTSGLAAITCLAHDLLVVLSAYILFRIPFNTTFIAVALTILGYSINASIIVFDRIRENRKFARRELFEETVDKSIWQTVGRTVNTSITTLLTVGMIFIFGVTSLASVYTADDYWHCRRCILVYVPVRRFLVEVPRHAAQEQT